MPPILPAANEETRNAELPALCGQRKDIGIAQPVGMHRLATLDEGERLQPVAEYRGELEIHGFGRARHRVAQSLLHRGRAAFQKILRIADEFGIIGLVDTIDTRRRTAPDLIEQARPRTIGEEAVGATAQQKGLLERVEGCLLYTSRCV